MISNVNSTPFFVNPNNIGRGKSIPLPNNFVQVNPNLVDTIPGLTEREAEILESIRELVGGSVMFNLGKHTSSNGLTVVQTGFNGRNTPFMVTHGMLREMAADENVYREQMELIQKSVRIQNDRERSFAENKTRAAQEDSERRSDVIRANVTVLTDLFWLNNQNEGSIITQPIQNQITQQVLGSYEQNLLIQDGEVVHK